MHILKRLKTKPLVVIRFIGNLLTVVDYCSSVVFVWLNLLLAWESFHVLAYNRQHDFICTSSYGHQP